MCECMFGDRRLSWRRKENENPHHETSAAKKLAPHKDEHTASIHRARVSPSVHWLPFGRDVPYKYLVVSRVFNRLKKNNNKEIVDCACSEVTRSGLPLNSNLAGFVSVKRSGERVRPLTDRLRWTAVTHAPPLRRQLYSRLFQLTVFIKACISH